MQCTTVKPLGIYARYFPQGGNHYAPDGVKYINNSLDGDQRLHPSIVKLFHTISNSTPEASNDGFVPLLGP